MAEATNSVLRAEEEASGFPEAEPANGLRRIGAVFRHRNYRLFFGGQLLSLIGTWMANTAQGWLVYQITGSKALLGMVAAASTAPMIVFSLVGGWAADRFPKRSILIGTQSASMLLSLAMAILVWSKVVAPWHIIVIALCGGVVMAFDMPTRQSFVVEITSKQDLRSAISLNSSMFNGARIIGPSIAGILMARTGIATCFFIDSISFVAVIGGLFLMRLPKHNPPPAEGPAILHATEGIRYALANPRVRTILTLFAIVGVFGWSYAVLMPAFARDVLKVSESGYGALLSSSGLGAFCGALMVATIGHRFTPRTLALGGVWLFSAMLLLFAFSRHLLVAMPLLAGAGIGMMLFFSTSNTTLQTIVPDHMRGRIMGLWSLIFGAMVPSGGLEAGTLAHFIGTPATVAIGAVVCAVAATVTLIVVRRREANESATATA